MPLAEIRAGVKARILTVPDVGKVWTFEPHFTRDEDRALYAEYGGEIRAWTITRESTEETEEPPNTCVNFANHLLIVRHYRSMNGHAATEETFQNAVETVRDALRLEQREWFGLTEVFKCGPPSVRLVEMRMLGQAGAGGPLVHYAEITLPVIEQTSPGS
jgi:hypothetical protein